MKIIQRHSDPYLSGIALSTEAGAPLHRGESALLRQRRVITLVANVETILVRTARSAIVRQRLAAKI
ncbi:hypothetical protein KCP75_01850 [Salmonella enterica subsp. enterica]|nr:hypothetical protein KCP75_01850 [Salmonella enterica subsp. enterica]